MSLLVVTGDLLRSPDVEALRADQPVGLVADLLNREGPDAEPVAEGIEAVGAQPATISRVGVVDTVLLLERTVRVEKRDVDDKVAADGDGVVGHG